MSVKEIKDAMEKGRVYFGIRQTLKNVKKNSNVFVSKDVREETIKKLENAKVEFTVLKSKEELSLELNLNFKCEVFSLK